MPTMFGTIWAQYVTGTLADNASGTISVHPNNRNVTAYSSITANFDPPVQFIVRSNVTEIRFRILAFDTGIRAVNVINYFE